MCTQMSLDSPIRGFKGLLGHPKSKNHSYKLDLPFIDRIY